MNEKFKVVRLNCKNRPAMPKEEEVLKKAGVDDKTIQMMIKQEEAKDPYATIGTREVKDKDGNTAFQNLLDDILHKWYPTANK